MTNYIILLLSAFSFFAYADEVNCESAITTFEMNTCSGRAMDEADTNLARYFAKAKEKFGQEQSMIDSLIKSQDAWVVFRKAHCDAIYEMWSGGTIRGVMFGGCMLQLTKQRTHNIWESYLTYMDSTPPLLPEPERYEQIEEEKNEL